MVDHGIERGSLGVGRGRIPEERLKPVITLLAFCVTATLISLSSWLAIWLLLAPALLE